MTTTVRFGKKEIELPIVIEGNTAKVVRGGPVTTGLGNNEGVARTATARPREAVPVLTPAPAPTLPVGPRYRSKLEAFYAAHLAALQHAGEIQTWRYENIRLVLGAKTSLTPDFHVINKDGRHEFRETKGWAREDAMVKLKVAARQFAWATFYLVTRQQGQWIEKIVTP